MAFSFVNTMYGSCTLKANMNSFSSFPNETQDNTESMLLFFIVQTGEESDSGV